MKNLRLFETGSQYETAQGVGFEYPTVSYVIDPDAVHYMTLRDKYKREYLTFKALEDGTFTFTMDAKLPTTCVPSIAYSMDNGETWTTTDNVDSQEVVVTTPTITAGNKVLWKSNAVQFHSNPDSSPGNNSGYGSFTSSGNYNVEGNIMSLLYGDNFNENNTFKQYVSTGSSAGAFAYLFHNNTKLLSVEYLILPATTLADSCYHSMFSGCTALTTAPELPATTLANNCYYSMFDGCTSLTTVPELPATTLANYCYSFMFSGCASLITAPVLPVTTLANNCYSSMFSGCTALTTAPELLATTLAQNCYSSMFNGCTSLTTAPELPATTLAQNCYSGMFGGCTSLTTAPVLPATTLAQNCYSAMFYGCTALTTAPELPATTLANGCYNQMFQGCTSLTTALVLPATTLADSCCVRMFYNCRSLTTAPELPATTLANKCYNQMFYNCTSLTTAPELPATTLVQSCYEGMFSGCTSLTTAPELPATALASRCYQLMFDGCSKLNYIKAMFTTTPSASYTSNWVRGVASTGTFVKNSAAEWDVTGNNGVPSGWTIESQAIMTMWIDDFPEDEPGMYDGTSIEDMMDNAIEDPEGSGANPYFYTGDTMAYNGNTYYVWVSGMEGAPKYLLTTTVDFDTLSEESMEVSGYNAEFTSLYARMDEDQTYVLTQETDQKLITVYEN